MKSSFGIYLYQKERPELHVLKDMLQFLKTTSPGRGGNFAYVEAETSLIPNLSLWENLKVELGGSSWQEFTSGLDSRWQPLVNILINPDLAAQKAEPWEKFTVSLLKGIMTSSPNLLIDMNENLLPPLMIQNFKKSLMKVMEEKKILLASSNTSLWLDSAHSLVTRVGYEFSIERLDQDQLKRHWA